MNNSNTLTEQTPVATSLPPFSLTQPFAAPPTVAPGQAKAQLWFTFQGDKLLVFDGPAHGELCILPPAQLGFQPHFQRYLGCFADSDCFVAEIPQDSTIPPGYRLSGLRLLADPLGNDLFALAGRALQILHWQREHRFCGKCGCSTSTPAEGLAISCSDCGFTVFPRLSPAVIMAVIRDERILLARSPHFTRGMYSTLAGFVEPGENLEEAVQREIYEEVNIEVDNIRYLASQPWPFPHSLMIGFTARYRGGKLRVDGDEIEDAGWFTRDELPMIPAPITIARFLIDSFINQP